MQTYAKSLAVALIAAMALAGCAPTSSNTYTREQMNQAAIVETGRIVSMRTVPIETSGRTGTLVGAGVGGVAGSFIGGDWRSNLLAGLAGAVVGGIAGNAAERAATAGNATEFIVEVDGGGTIAVVQTNDDALRVGDRVTILRGERTRLTPARG
jgi:outer membrane lipoprotein SlyB